MKAIDSSSTEMGRREQLLAAARAAAEWGRTRQAAWAPASASARVSFDPRSAIEPLPSAGADAETTAPLVDWRVPAAWVARHGKNLLPIGRAFLRVAMAGLMVAVAAAAVTGGRKGLAYWQEHRPVMALPPPAVIVARPPQRSIRATRHAHARQRAAALPDLPKVPAGVDGWIRIVAPFRVTVSEADRTLWLYDQTVSLPPGTHALRFENQALGYASTQQVIVHAGGETTVSVVPPPSTLTVNAAAGGNVLVDGTSVGTTPLADCAIALGQHDILVRSPDGHERRFTLTVTVTPIVLNVEF